MDENEVTNNEFETPVYHTKTDEELKEKIEEAAKEVFGESTEEVEETRPIDVVFTHPQQILNNKQIQLLFRKQAWLEKEKQARKERGEDEQGAEELTPTEKSAIDLFILRAKHHHSKPKALSTKQRAAKKVKRKLTKQSRKANR
jgi:hypothetical protein